jgi:hypothetical protein
MGFTIDLGSIEAVWHQTTVPVVYRAGVGQPILIRLPYRDDNYEFLRDERTRKPKWVPDGKYWEVPASWFNDIVERILGRWRRLYIIQPYREQEKCAPACWNAVGHVCQCSCMGEHHGTRNPEGSWFIVSDTFAARWRDRQLACRLLIAKSQVLHR